MWIAIAGLLLTAYLPGAVIFRLPWVERARRAQLPSEERFFWAVLISASLSVLVVLALAVASRYTLSRVLLVNGGLAGAMAVAARGRLLYAGTAARPGWSALLAAVVLAVGVWLFLPPAEYVIGGRDPGVYFNEGIRIAQRGSLIIEDPVIASVPRASRDLFFPSHRSRFYYGLRFMGFFIMNPDSGAVSSQFPQLFPASIAIGYGLDGLTGARLAPVFWGLLGLLALFVTGARLVGAVPAAAGALLLSVCVAQVWFSRYPASEIMMQPLLLGALLAYTRAHEDEDRFFGPLAGVLLGMLLVFRVEAVLALAGIAIAAALEFVRGRRPRTGFVVSLVVAVALAGRYLAVMLRSYVQYPVAAVLNLALLQMAAVAICAALVLVLVVAAARRPRIAHGVRMWAPRVLIAAVAAGAGYAYFLRMPGGKLAEGDATALRTFAWYYTSGPALAAAVVGYAIVVRRRFWRDPALLVTTTLFAFFLFYKPRIVPEHFWQARRFLPLVLPMTLLLASAGAMFAMLPDDDPTRGLTKPRWRWPAAAAGAVFLIYVGSLLLGASRPILNHVEYQGVIARIEALARKIRDDDLVLVESRSASDLHVLAAPLAYIYARNVLVFATPIPDKKRLADLLADARGRYGRVLFLGGPGTDLLSAFIAVRQVDTELFRIPEYEQVRNAFPRTVRLKEFSFGTYEFVDPPPPTAGFTLEMGHGDDLYVLRMHHPERAGGRTFRWTTGISLVTVLGITPQTRKLTLWMNNGGRPARLGPVVPRITLNDRPLDPVTVTDRFEPYTFELPIEFAADIARGDGSARLRIATDTWTPGTVLSNGDTRQLGIILARVEVR